ncbi:MAG: MgtC/SapB family protein [Ruminococcus sp.]
MEGILSYLKEFNFASVLLRLFLAMVCGGLLGLERRRKHRPAGARTYMMVCMGAALTMLIGEYEYYMTKTVWADIVGKIGVNADVSRFGAQVVNGIGFLGAGTILINGRKQSVKGLTTAAGLWASGCMGLAIGVGFFECVILGGLLIFIAMRVLPSIEEFFIERAPIINIYVEFQSMDNLREVLTKIKEQHGQILDLDLNHGGSESALNPSIVVSLALDSKLPHTRILLALAGLECVQVVEEL